MGLRNKIHNKNRDINLNTSAFSSYALLIHPQTVFFYISLSFSIFVSSPETIKEIICKIADLSPVLQRSNNK